MRWPLGMQAGEAPAETFARPEICLKEPDTANRGALRHQRRYSGAALWRSLLPNRHSGAPRSHPDCCVGMNWAHVRCSTTTHGRQHCCTACVRQKVLQLPMWLLLLYAARVLQSPTR